MTVAERFGPKTATIDDLRIQLTVAQLLAATSVPEEICEAAIKRAECGERITVSVVKKMLCTLTKQQVRHDNEEPQGLPAEKCLNAEKKVIHKRRRIREEAARADGECLGVIDEERLCLKLMMLVCEPNAVQVRFRCPNDLKDAVWNNKRFTLCEVRKVRLSPDRAAACRRTPAGTLFPGAQLMSS